jgi:hypothetical protein
MAKIFSNSSTICISIDLDWACEEAIETTLDFFQKKGIPLTVFTTHDSEVVRERINTLEVGLHPYFHQDSDHGPSISKTIETVFNLPHNLNAYRSHRFIISNEIKHEMKEAGMICSSNVCTNLEVLSPFHDRINILEVPIFLEDGGYLYNRNPLEMNSQLKAKIGSPGIKMIVLHPMHFTLNSPNWDFMVGIKKSVRRHQWKEMSAKMLSSLLFNGIGIRTFIEDFIEQADILNVKYCNLREIVDKYEKPVNSLAE